MKGIYSNTLRYTMHRVVSMLKNSRCKHFQFHNYNHTLEVVTHTIDLAARCDMNFYQMEPIIIASWLHDVGYTEVYEGHEEVSIRIAKELFEEMELDWNLVNKILDLIWVTRVPQNPLTLEEKIICDADLFHLGTRDFSHKNECLRQELRSIDGKVYSDNDWILSTLEFMDAHTYFTEFGRNYLTEFKLRNISDLEKQLHTAIR